MGIVLFKKLDTKAIIPTKAHETDAGFDFYSIEERTIYPNTYAVIDTGIAWEPGESILRKLPEYLGIYLKLESRSGLACKNGLEKGAGIIDQDYRGSIRVKLFNQSENPYRISKGDKVCQGIISPFIICKAVETDNLSETIRGEKGFGSSGN